MSNSVLGKRIKSFVLRKGEGNGEVEQRGRRRLQMRHTCVGGGVDGGGGGGGGGGGEIVHLLSSLVLLISIAQVSAQSLHPVSRATCGRNV